MTNELILNPFLKHSFIGDSLEEATALRLTVPTRETGVRNWQFSADEQPALYELFSELAQTSFNFLDVDADLSDAERDLLARQNILIRADETSQPPLFQVFLDEIETTQTFENHADLIVNPTFVYEAANDYQTAITRRSYGMLANAPSVWITDAGTKIQLGVWLRGDYVELLQGFAANEKPSGNLTDAQIAQLRAAQILTTTPEIERRARDWQTKIDENQRTFAAEKYTILRGILPEFVTTAIRDYLDNLRGEGFMLFNDEQVKRRFAVHNDALPRYFHEQLADLISRVANQKVIPSYVYAATYVEGGVLEPHTDRAQCEFTLSFQVDYKPDLRGAQSPWALCVDDLRERRVEGFLAIGDGFLYKGCELVHYRDALAEGHQSTSIFFHFVNENFAGSLD